MIKMLSADHLILFPLQILSVVLVVFILCVHAADMFNSGIYYRGNRIYLVLPCLTSTWSSNLQNITKGKQRLSSLPRNSRESVTDAQQQPFHLAWNTQHSFHHPLCYSSNSSTKLSSAFLFPSISTSWIWLMLLCSRGSVPLGIHNCHKIHQKVTKFCKLEGRMVNSSQYVHITKEKVYSILCTHLELYKHTILPVMFKATSTKPMHRKNWIMTQFWYWLKL